MNAKKTPKLRTVSKVQPPYPIGKFPKGFIFKTGRELVYLLATSHVPSVEGKVWEQIFAGAVGAEWKPSNVGLDDIVSGVCAWGAKSLYETHPHKAKTVRLISGRNSPAFSFGETDLSAQADYIGAQVLEIWNARVEALRDKFSHLRTVVLMKSNDLTEFAVFETETVRYPPDRYKWERNKKGNLEGFDAETGLHRFTWQPSGSQFTIIESVPESRICFRIRKPEKFGPDTILKAIGYDKSWIEIVKE